MPQLDTDFNFRTPSYGNTMARGMQLKRMKQQLDEYPEERAYIQKKRGWEEEDRTRAIKSLKFKDEKDALDYLIESAPMITYDNYMDSKAHLEELGLNPELLPPIETFGAPGSTEARQAFDEYKKNGIVSAKQRLEQYKTKSQKDLQTQRDTAAMKRVETQQKGAMERVKAQQSGAMKREKLRQKNKKKVDDSKKLSFAEKEQYKYLIGRLEAIDEKLYGEFSDDITEDELERLQTERNVILDGMMAIEGKAGGTSEKSDNQDVRGALQKLKDAGISKEDVKSYVKTNPNATINDVISHFSKTSENSETKSGMSTAQTAETPTVKNIPSKKAPTEKTGLKRKSIPYYEGSPTGPTDEQKEAAKQELVNLAKNLGAESVIDLESVVPSEADVDYIGKLAQKAGGWTWNKFKEISKVLLEGQKESRKRLPAYGGK